MIKQMVQWEGFDGKQTTRTVYFNLTRFEIAHDMELEVLEQRFKAFQEDVIGDEKRDMTPPEIREMLDIFKVLIKHAYGVRSQDGKRFVKNEEIWNEFVETGAFDAFVWYMFEDPNRADAFMKGIWPKEIQEAAAKVREERPDLKPVPEIDPMDADTNGLGEVDDMDLTVDPQDATDDEDIPSITSLEDRGEGPLGPYEVKDSLWDYNQNELLAMSNGEFNAVKKKFSEGKNVPQQLLVIEHQRKSRGETTE